MAGTLFDIQLHHIAQRNGSDPKVVQDLLRPLELASIIKSRTARDPSAHCSPNAAKAAVDAMVLKGVGKQPRRHEVLKFEG
jgi:hypothetical protein